MSNVSNLFTALVGGGASALKARGGDSDFSGDELVTRRNSMLETYGHSDYIKDWVNDRDFKAQFEPISLDAFGEYGKSAENKATIQRINTARARWNDLSDAERAIATDDQKLLTEGYNKDTKEKQALQEVSRVMDQREARSKAIGGTPKAGGGRPILTSGGPSIFGAPTPGAKTLLGQ